MKRIFILLALLLPISLGAAPVERKFHATYTATISNIPAGVPEMKVWIPLPSSGDGQTIDQVTIDSPYTWTRQSERLFGDDYAFATIPLPPPGALSVRVHFSGTRRELTQAAPGETTSSRSELSRLLKADRLVTLSPRVRKLAAEVTAGKTTPSEQARAIYDHLLATMTYDKTTPGWGRGDTERACDVRKGNCTDFHSLFLSLARAKGIPARFVIGFPMPASGGKVAGYHCWAEFWVRGKGWIPVDASDASKTTDAARREYLFGNLDPDRVQFSTGRDLVLKPPTAEPLNFFIYPHAEANGKEIGSPSIALEVD
jgi:transglutaminase-like putative cysteine protease